MTKALNFGLKHVLEVYTGNSPYPEVCVFVPQGDNYKGSYTALMPWENQKAVERKLIGYQSHSLSNSV